MNKLLIALYLMGIFISCTNNNSEKKITGNTQVKLFASPVSDSCAEPYLFTDKNGAVYLSWIEKKGKNSSLKFSTLLKDQWSKPVTISSGNNWFVNWADYPVVVTDGKNNLLAHFLEKSDTAKFTYDIKMITSNDDGKFWSHPKLLHDDGKKAEHGFVSIMPYKEHFFVSWLDGRKTAVESDDAHHEGHHGEMTLRAAMLDKSGNKTNEWELDGKVCDCCQTSVAITDNGPVVVYRDRSDDEIRDMSIVRYVNGQWTAPKTVFPDLWKIKACPVNGPRADAMGNNLAIAMFSMKDKKGQVKVVFSEDGGNSFKEPVRIDEGNAIGRIAIVMLDNKTAMVSWMEGPQIKAVRVHADGTKEPSILISSSSESRSGGFPQMTKSGDNLYFAWTDNKEKTIKVAKLSL